METETEEIQKEIAQEFVTPYMISKMLKSSGIERKPQQMYTYVRNNLIPSEVVGTQRLVKIEDAEAFVVKFVAKHSK